MSSIWQYKRPRTCSRAISSTSDIFDLTLSTHTSPPHIEWSLSNLYRQVPITLWPFDRPRTTISSSRRFRSSSNILEHFRTSLILFTIYSTSCTESIQTIYKQYKHLRTSAIISNFKHISHTSAAAIISSDTRTVHPYLVTSNYTLIAWKTIERIEFWRTWDSFSKYFGLLKGNRCFPLSFHFVYFIICII
jgi:hypothetical protein